jgi:outer membrane receptor protein involved in Fe transport
MNRFCYLVVYAVLWGIPWLAAADDLKDIRNQIQILQKDYERRIRALEERLEKAEADASDARQQAEAAEAIANEAALAPATSRVQEKANTFNPAITAVLQGSLNSYSQDPDDYALPGFQTGGEAGLAAEGLTLDETELILSASVDQLFFGQTTIALHDDGNETEVEVEEAFIDALAMPAGTGLRFGRFYSDIGYLNKVHTHAWDFRDAPLVYRSMLGKQYADDGLQLSWIAPTDFYLRVGGETLRGDRFPGGEATDTLGNSQSLFVKFGGDVGASHSWQAGLSQLWVDAVDRDSSGHSHGGMDSTGDSFTGDSNLTIVDFVWKWSPQGNSGNRNLIFQSEFFYRDEDGTDDFTESGDTAVLDYDGTQKGLYAQLVYQFMPQWRLGVRYDWLSSDNDLRVLDAGGLDPNEVLEETALNSDGHDPNRWSLMADWSPSEFSRLRLQYNRDESRHVVDDQWTLQYIMSLGSHAAHEF